MSECPKCKKLERMVEVLTQAIAHTQHAPGFCKICDAFREQMQAYRNAANHRTVETRENWDAVRSYIRDQINKSYAITKPRGEE